MKAHADKGAEIISKMIDNFSFRQSHFIPQLVNMVRHHHENIDGSGYPAGLKGANIPPESRMVAVADVFDALTSDRPYKAAWSNNEAFTELHKLTSWKLDSSYVAALEKNREEVEAVQRKFKDEPLE